MSDTPAPDDKHAWPKRAYHWAASRTSVALIMLSLGALVALVVVAGTQGYLLDWDLLLEYIKVLWGWPAVVLILGVVLRKSLPLIFENGGKFEGFGVSAEINQRDKETQETSQDVAADARAKVKELTERAKSEIPAGTTTTPMPELGSADFQDLITLAPDEPASAMNQAWGMLGQRLVQVYDDPGYTGIPARDRQDEAVRETWNADLLEADWITTYADLRAQRFRRGRRSPKAALRFVVTAENLYSALDIVAVRKWARANGISDDRAHQIFLSQRNATEASGQPQ